MLESQGAKQCQKPGLHPDGLASHLNNKEHKQFNTQAGFFFQITSTQGQNKLFANLCEYLYLLMKTKSKVVLKSCSTFHKLHHSQIFNMNSTVSEIEKAFLQLNFLSRTIQLASIVNLFLPKATGNQHSQYVTKMC